MLDVGAAIAPPPSLKFGVQSRPHVRAAQQVLKDEAAAECVSLG
jgi:hypothetical protein